MSMITGQIEELRNLADAMEKSGQGISAKYVRNAAETIEDLSDKLAEKNCGWIPCSERLPKEDDHKVWNENYDVAVLWSTDTGAVNVGRYYDFTKIWTDMNDLETNDAIDGNVIAWMPLPEPYKEE